MLGLDLACGQALPGHRGLTLEKLLDKPLERVLGKQTSNLTPLSSKLWLWPELSKARLAN